MRRIISQGLVAVALAALFVGCGGSTPTTPTTPTTPAVSITDTFTGDLHQSGTNIHPFSVVAQGVVTATLTALSPLSTASIGMSYGLWDGTNCNAITNAVVQNDNVKVGTALVGTATSALSMCLRVYDVGNIPEGGIYTYTVTVVHY